jgi:hypothetical protein
VIEISVLCPTRCRPRQLRESFESMMDRADRPHEVEFLAAVDPDDPWLEFQSWTGPSFWIWTAPERYGYERLHEYYNALARTARGRWLMLWNDDAVMQTRGWDTVIAGKTCDQALQPWHSDGGYAHNDFPVWPRRWTDYLGYVSQTSCCDAWVSHTSELLGRVCQVPVRIKHDRDPVVIASHLGTAEPGGLYDPEMIMRRERDADRLAEAIRTGIL